LSVSHRPRKRFSQNFLVDRAIIGDIIAAISPQPDDVMVEIGPGLAALTRPLAAAVNLLHVVEIDRDIVARLRDMFAPERVVIHEGDALELDFSQLGAPLRVVGNLPYHISTPLLFHLADSALMLRDIHVMLQKEVVDRMVAVPGSSEYGRLSVMLQYRFEMEKLIDVPPCAFRPPPKVESAVVRMLPHEANALCARDERLFAETVAAAFSQRRKTLRNTLAQVLAPDDLAGLGIDPQRRAQTLTIADFVKIADYRASARCEAERKGGVEGKPWFPSDS
jgi:16S rRNA (adenine1518-N6/adenine1519-N6)-dimethyltransferase